MLHGCKKWIGRGEQSLSIVQITVNAQLNLRLMIQESYTWMITVVQRGEGQYPAG